MQQIVNRFAHKIGAELGYDSEKVAVIAYGMLCLAQMLVITGSSIILGAFTKTILESLVVVCMVGIYRKNAGGVHASNMESCIIISLASIVLMACTAKYLLAGRLDNMTIILFHILVFLSIFGIAYRYVPLDSAAKRITNPEKIKRLRMKTFAFIALFFVLGGILLWWTRYTDANSLESLYYAGILALLWQSFTLTPIGAKVILPMNNFVNNTLLGKK